MTAIITDPFKKQLVQTIFQEVSFPDSASTHKYYLGIGKSEQWNNTETVPAATDTPRSIRNVRAGLQSIKSANDVTFTIPRYNWSSGGIYSAYSDDLSAIPSNSYYVLTEDNQVYICLQQGKSSTGAPSTSTVKPAGTTSLVLGTSSGIHAWHNDYYIRRIRVGKNESIYPYLKQNHPELIEDEYFRPHDTACITVPQKAPSGSITRTESPFALLDRVKKVAADWVVGGHRKGSNTHNVSATISLKKEDWELAGEWMWTNRDSYNGLAVLPYDGGSYTQAPFEDITKTKYKEMMKSLTEIDLSNVIEVEDNTDLSGELACAGGSCEIT